MPSSSVSSVIQGLLEVLRQPLSPREFAQWRRRVSEILRDLERQSQDRPSVVSSTAPKKSLGFGLRQGQFSKRRSPSKGTRLPEPVATSASSRQRSWNASRKKKSKTVAKAQKSTKHGPLSPPASQESREASGGCGQSTQYLS